VVSVKLMQKQKKVVHHRRPQLYVVTDLVPNASLLRWVPREARVTLGGHRSEAAAVNDQTDAAGVCGNRMMWYSRLKDLDCTVPAQQQQQQPHDDGGGDHDDDVPRRINGNGLAVSRTKVCTQRKSHAAAASLRTCFARWDCLLLRTVFLRRLTTTSSHGVHDDIRRLHAVAQARLPH
jgi:hypothetical protein